jgi:hypothetical protein
MAQARAAMAGVAPALEIVERWGDFAADLNLALADNAQQKAFVTGPVTSPLPPNVRLSEASVEVVVNGQRGCTGAERLRPPSELEVFLRDRQEKSIDIAGHARSPQVAFTELSYG